MLIVVMSDTGGYVAGVLFGKHPMAPKISPKKSWEGFAGSLVFGIARRRLHGDVRPARAVLGRHHSRASAWSPSVPAAT